ncbi:hypothetical protein [Haloarchaeobius sp. HRN-SO-5]|uniref:hypothetical protein n=1 Tax=Haloarchaeobius sp. HRN-SO-5 TaxID=3446118 RepID=UPI003EB9ADFD
MGSLDDVRRRLRAAVLTETEGSEYVCRSCESGYDVQHHICPDCGSYSVERLDW